MAKRKSEDTSTQKESIARAWLATQPLTHSFSWREIGLSEKEATNYALVLADWSKRPDSIHLDDFWELLGTSRQSWEFWEAKYPEIKAATRYAKDKIGKRRERMAIFNRDSKANPETIHKSLRYYDYVWKELYDEDVANKAETTVNTNAQIQYQYIQDHMMDKPSPEEVAIKAKASTKLGSRKEGKVQSKRDNSL